MSESSAPRTAPPRFPPAAVPSGSTLFRSLTGPLSRWLPRQRWYADKGRPLSGLVLVSATELLPCSGGGPSPGLLHLLVRTVPQGRPQHTGSCYQLLLGVRSVLPPTLTGALVGRPPDGPLRGRAVYDALYDPRLAALLLERFRKPGSLGTLRFERAADADIPTGLTARALTGDQTNSSVVYGDAHILKLFRRVSAGVNPDLELPRALARADCRRVPPPAAWFTAESSDDPPGQVTLGVLQPFLSGSTDGWQLALESLSGCTDFTPAAHDLGRATAEVHRTLATALPTTVLGGDQLEATAHAMNERLAAAAGAVPALRPYRHGLSRAFGTLAEYARGGGYCAAQRLHGDLHLGQVLRQGGQWSLIDFEGEPARPLSERRRPQPPVRDIAGMLRSFDYAAGQHCTPGTQVTDWATANRAAYCRGYAQVAGEQTLARPELLQAYETDKAVYEVLYEARHRPAWLHIPMAAVRRLAA